MQQIDCLFNNNTHLFFDTKIAGLRCPALTITRRWGVSATHIFPDYNAFREWLARQR